MMNPKHILPVCTVICSRARVQRLLGLLWSEDPSPPGKCPQAIPSKHILNLNLALTLLSLIAASHDVAVTAQAQEVPGWSSLCKFLSSLCSGKRLDTWPEAVQSQSRSLRGDFLRADVKGSNRRSGDAQAPRHLH